MKAGISESVARMRRLRAFMAANGITNKDLSEVLNIGQPAVSMMLRKRAIRKRRRQQLLDLGFPEDTLPMELQK